MTKKKGGRPALPANQKRKNRVRVHFSELEMQHLTRIAGSDGIVEGGIPSYIRMQALGRKIHSNPRINQEAWIELARVAANLNQIARRCNLAELGGAVPPEIEEIQEALAALRRKLLGEGFFPAKDTKTYISCVMEDE